MRTRSHRGVPLLSALLLTAAVTGAMPVPAAGQAGEPPPPRTGEETAVPAGDRIDFATAVDQETPDAGQAPAAPAIPLVSNGPVLPLTLDEAVRRAVANNPALAIVELEVQSSAAGMDQARSAFAPVITASAGRVQDTFPPASRFFDSAVEANDWFGTGSIRQRLPWGGGTWSLSMDASRTETDSPISNFDPVLRQNVMLAFSQPLFKNRGIDPARQQLIIASRDQKISDLQFEETLVRTVAAVKMAYWNLKASLGTVELQERSIDLVEELVERNRARAAAGQLPSLDVVAAEAELARRQSQLILAERVAGDAEDQLKRLIISPTDSAFWAMRLDPVDEPQTAALAPDLANALSATLQGRLDILLARQRLEQTEADIRYYTNQQLPDVRLEVSYAPTGLGGAPAERDGLFPVPVEQGPTSFGRTLRQLLHSDYPSWSVGFTVSHPLGQTYEAARLARATIGREQARQRVMSLEIQAIEEIRGAAREIASTAERIKATRAGAELAAQRLQVEQARLDAGLSTPFYVTQAQRDLLEAEVALLRATLDNQAAMIAFETLQLAPALSGASEVALRGATLVPIAPALPAGIARPGLAGPF